MATSECLQKACQDVVSPGKTAYKPGPSMLAAFPAFGRSAVCGAAGGGASGRCRLDPARYLHTDTGNRRSLTND